MKLVFMGTPEIAETALTALLQDGHEVVGVYTRADKPQGRKQVVTPSPVKKRAGENRIVVYQPATLRSAEAQAQLAALEPELIVVVAYGLILPPQVLAIPTYGCINLHVSLLPAYRGAAPIQWAVINGEEKTGVSIMQLDEGLDTGPVIAQQKIGIPPDATAGELFEMVGGIGARLLAQTVQAIAGGTAKATPQSGQPSAAPQLNKQMAQMDFGLPAQRLHNLVRGCNPWPLAWFVSGGKRVKVLRSRLEECPGGGRCGTVLNTNPLTLACGEGALVLEHVVPEGSRPMSGAEWAAGRRFGAGDSVL